jgi:hypothetical protein
VRVLGEDTFPLSVTGRFLIFFDVLNKAVAAAVSGRPEKIEDSKSIIDKLPTKSGVDAALLVMVRLTHLAEK